MLKLVPLDAMPWLLKMLDWTRTRGRKFWMVNPHGVDFEQVVRNAEKEGIDLAEIALFYEGLADIELSELKRHGLFATKTARCVIGKYNKEGVPLFPDKVTGVYTLSA